MGPVKTNQLTGTAPLKSYIARCVNSGRNEAFAEDSFESEPREDQIRSKIYQLSAGIAAGKVRFVVSPQWKCAAESNVGR